MTTPGTAIAAAQLMAPTASSSLTSRPLDLVMAIFFALHLFPSVVFAPQVALPPHLADMLVPIRFKTLLRTAAATSGDPLLRMAIPSADGGVPREPWAAAIFASETFLQTPFFIYAVIALCLDWSSFRLPAIIYSVHVLTTMIPIMAELAFGRIDTFAQGSQFENADEQSIRIQWIAMYAPFVVMPFILLVQQLFFPRDIGRDRAIAEAKAAAVRAELAASIMRADARAAAAAAEPITVPKKLIQTKNDENDELDQE